MLVLVLLLVQHAFRVPPLVLLWHGMSDDCLVVFGMLDVGVGACLVVVLVLGGAK